MRVFAALYPDTEAREEMSEIIRELLHAPAPVKWESPDKIHITLKFIAEIHSSALNTAIESVREEIGARSPMRFEIQRVDGFPTLRRPRIIWVGGGEAPEGMIKIHTLLEDAFSAEGIERETKKFRPHFTIGRVKQFGNTRDLINLLESCSFQSFDTVFNELRFMESRLTPQGAIHEEIDRISFLK